MYKRQYWRCTERDKCNARCSTPVDDHTKILRDGTSKHTHAPEKAEIGAKKAVQRMKRRAEQHPNEPPDRILAMEIQDEHDKEVLANLPETENLRRYVNRTQNRLRPRNPQNLAEVEIVDPYKDKTRAGDKFLFYDSGIGGEDRVIIFTTEKNIKRLCESPSIFSNGTFKSAPNMFTQMFTLRGRYKWYLFPFVFALTTTKNEITYGMLYHQSIKYCALQFFRTSVTLKRRYTQEKHQIKSFDLREIYEFDFSFFSYLASFQSYGSLKNLERAVNN